MNRLYLNRVSAYILFVLVLAFACSNASAAFVDDFEDGNADGWMETYNGSGSTGVTTKNSSQMAYSSHSGSGKHLLSMDFDYMGSSILAFDMLATSYTNRGANAASGVELTFLDNWNAVLGSARFINVTSASWLGDNDVEIQDLQHNYSDSMSSFATLAGLGGGDAISKLSLSFFAVGQTDWVYNSSATVWFDNVTVGAGAVPIPAAVWLFGSGLLGLLGASRKKMA